MQRHAANLQLRWFELKAKTRLDQELVARGLAASRSRAQALILAESVLVDGQKAQKAGLLVGPETKIELVQELPYVSRGGLKLEQAIDAFGVDPTGKVVIDVGASTGGFTDCLLKRGAKLVYAVDVGYGQLAWNLRTDDRVVCMERTNARHLEPGQFPQKPELGVMDVSFISLELVIPALIQCMTPEWELVTLIKPQFEAGREQVGKHGVVRDEKVHLEVLERLFNFAKEHEYPWQNLTYSPILGPQGNIEFLAQWAPVASQLTAADLKTVVTQAHGQLTERG